MDRRLCTRWWQKNRADELVASLSKWVSLNISTSREFVAGRAPMVPLYFSCYCCWCCDWGSSEETKRTLGILGREFVTRYWAFSGTTICNTVRWWGVQKANRFGEKFPFLWLVVNELMELKKCWHYYPFLNAKQVRLFNSTHPIVTLLVRGMSIKWTFKQSVQIVSFCLLPFLK